ncbi:Serine/threonine-protein kinase [Actinidia chinensis var. chinensis]|uniref:Serine/threonine-protein kinase n=1 Tax=Actinidia chinensis var. chinensis TaxID=1590841 RepID=A0A2R6RP75_ACTCC|nr:Serine/threonine-protein kinase [Actinidia chinensis var. chinensis]
MGCICSKGSNADDFVVDNVNERELNKSSVQVLSPSKKEEIIVGVVYDESVKTISKPVLQANMSSVRSKKDEEDKKTRIVERPTSGHHQRRATLDALSNDGRATMSRMISLPHATEREQIAAGWPSWLTSVAGEAVQGWLPRSADSFEKLNKIGQGTYSSVYKARDLKTGKIVAMKKVRFVNMDPESVRFMAREIHVLRKLDHPNVMKLEGLVTSRVSGSLYLVFEYMEHDLAGLAASAKIKFTEPQIKCYVQQLLSGLEHCHSRGVLHRDIKGSNLLIDNNGVLKIGDFGLATFFQPDQKQPLTSRVVTLWYRAPELLLGATEYGVAIDLWSAGCILAELFVGKPIMPGRTEVEQMHKIFKLCGSPSEEYWKKSKLPHATSFKPQQPYGRCVLETFKDFPSSALALIDVLLAIEPEQRGTAASALNSEFFITKPLACDPSSLPKYLPSKEFDIKLREEEARRRKAEAGRGRGAESVRRGPRECEEVPTPEFDAQGQITLQGESNPKNISVKYNPHEDGGSGFPIDPPRGFGKNGSSHSSSMVHPSAVGGYLWAKKAKEHEGNNFPVRTIGSSGHRSDLRRQTSYMPQETTASNAYSKQDDRMSAKDSRVYVSKKSRIHCSGPLMPPGSNMEDMLKEHERQIQEAVRKARLDKARTKRNCYDKN